jgi:V8-like Glu-specific endopeptidase
LATPCDRQVFFFFADFAPGTFYPSFPFCPLFSRRLEPDVAIEIQTPIQLMPESIPPLNPEQVAEKFKPRAATSDKLSILTQRFFVAGGKEPPQIRTKIVRVEGGHAGHDVNHYELVLEIEGVRLGARAYPAPIMGKGFRRGLPKTQGDGRQALLSGFVPDHLPFAPSLKHIVSARRTIFDVDGSRIKRPTTVFAPDDRRIFQDTSHPWSTVGLVQTPHGTGSGVMIGPRHLLTVSHVIDWNVAPPFAANWVKFTPSYFDGSEPFGHAFSTNIYWFNKDSGDNTIDQTEEQFDYVVVVLDSRIGEQTGWMGARGYSDSWDGLNVWSHMGYPGDLNNGQRPSFQGGFPMDGSDSEPDTHEAITHKADVFPGQSGGPMFGWWDGDVGPRAVGTQSWQTSDENGASGGGDLDELVIQARTDHP